MPTYTDRSSNTRTCLPVQPCVTGACVHRTGNSPSRRSSRPQALLGTYCAQASGSEIPSPHPGKDSWRLPNRGASRPRRQLQHTTEGPKKMEKAMSRRIAFIIASITVTVFLAGLSNRICTTLAKAQQVTILDPYPLHHNLDHHELTVQAGHSRTWVFRFPLMTSTSSAFATFAANTHRAVSNVTLSLTYWKRNGTQLEPVTTTAVARPYSVQVRSIPWFDGVVTSDQVTGYTDPPSSESALIYATRSPSHTTYNLTLTNHGPSDKTLLVLVFAGAQIPMGSAVTAQTSLVGFNDRNFYGVHVKSSDLVASFFMEPLDQSDLDIYLMHSSDPRRKRIISERSGNNAERIMIKSSFNVWSAFQPSPEEGQFYILEVFSWSNASLYQPYRLVVESNFVQEDEAGLSYVYHMTAVLLIIVMCGAGVGGIRSMCNRTRHLEAARAEAANNLDVLGQGPVRNPNAATTRELEQLTTMVFKVGMFPVRETDSGAVSPHCAVCLADYEEEDVLRQLPCKHHFHRACVDQWLRKKKHCPLCQQNITTAHDVYADEDARRDVTPQVGEGRGSMATSQVSIVIANAGSSPVGVPATAPSRHGSVSLRGSRLAWQANEETEGVVGTSRRREGSEPPGDPPGGRTQLPQRHIILLPRSPNTADAESDSAREFEL